MIASIVELLFGLCCSALILLGASSIVGSIVAALRGISRESDYGHEDAKPVFGVAEMTALRGGMIEPGVIVMTNPDHHCRL